MTDLTGPTAQKLADIITGKRESLHFETKRVSNKMVARALDTICAFANTEGGILALGVEDYEKAEGRDRLYGIEENPEAKETASPTSAISSRTASTPASASRFSTSSVQHFFFSNLKLSLKKTFLMAS